MNAPVPGACGQRLHCLHRGPGPHRPAGRGPRRPRPRRRPRRPAQPEPPPPGGGERAWRAAHHAIRGPGSRPTTPAHLLHPVHPPAVSFTPDSHPRDPAPPFPRHFFEAPAHAPPRRPTTPTPPISIPPAPRRHSPRPPLFPDAAAGRGAAAAAAAHLVLQPRQLNGLNPSPRATASQQHPRLAQQPPPLRSRGPARRGPHGNRGGRAVPGRGCGPWAALRAGRVAGRVRGEQKSGDPDWVAGRCETIEVCSPLLFWRETSVLVLLRTDTRIMFR
jgi:hypothetical protein